MVCGFGVTHGALLEGRVVVLQEECLHRLHRRLTEPLLQTTTPAAVSLTHDPHALAWMDAGGVRTCEKSWRFFGLAAPCFPDFAREIADTGS